MSRSMRKSKTIKIDCRNVSRTVKYLRLSPKTSSKVDYCFFHIACDIH